MFYKKWKSQVMMLMASGETAADSVTADLASAHGQRTVCFTPGFCALWETHKRK